MKKIFSFILMLTVTATTFQSCVKGDKGDNGSPGANGNSNVKSATFYVTPDDWTYGSSSSTYNTVIHWDGITENVKDSGAIIIYLQSVNQINWIQLPWTFALGNNVTESWKIYYTLGALSIDVQDSDFGEPANPGYNTIRLVAIGSGARKMMQQNNIDPVNYTAVKNYFNLKD